MNNKELKDYNLRLLMEIDGIQEVRIRDYNNLKEKYEAAEKKLKLELEGEDHPMGVLISSNQLRGYLSGLMDGMVLLDPDLISTCCSEEEFVSNQDFDIGF